MRPLNAMRAPRRLWQQLRRTGAYGLHACSGSRLALACTLTQAHTEWSHSRHIHSSTLHKQQQADADAAAAVAPAAAAFSGAASDSDFESLRGWLSTQCRAIPASSSDIRLLESPDEFYTTLLSLSQGAQQRVLLSSLYLGTGPHEEKLVETIRQRMEQQPDLRVNVLLDYLRGTRLVRAEGLSSVTALAPLMQPQSQSQPQSESSSASPRFSLHLLQLPPPAVPMQITPLRAWVERTFFTGNKTREAVGVHHMKFYVFDDHVIISGANLSDTYFTNRQDRYVLIRNKELADFYQALMAQMERLPFCHTISKQGSLPAPLAAPRPVPFVSGGDESDWSRRVALGQSVSRLFTPDKDAAAAATPAPPQKQQPSNTDTLLFPTLQMGTLFVTHDQRMTAGLFSLASSPRFKGDRPARGMDVATGYMNLTHEYQSLIVEAKSTVRVLAAAEDANGWFGAKGAGRFVPQLYEAAAYEFLMNASLSEPTRAHLYEWSKSKWSYHAKGMWMTLPDAVAPQLTVIGSPNFGARSVQRDSETALIVLTQADSSLARDLAAERQRLFAHSKLVTLDGDKTDEEYEGQVVKAKRQPLWIRILSGIARPYM